MNTRSFRRHFIRLGALVLIFAINTIGLRLPQADVQPGAEAKLPRHHGRRYWDVQYQCLQPRHMGYKTPNIDRIAKEGALLTDWYAQQSCTAGGQPSSLVIRRSARA